MWEAIQRNRRRSRMLIAVMFILLLVLGIAVGGAVDPEVGPIWGFLVALIVWFVMWLVSIIGGDHLLLSSAGAHRIEKQDAPQLWNIVEEMSIASGLPQMPEVFLIEDDAPNAFAVGRKPGSAAVAVTSGLVKRLSRDEIQGVVGHEIGHVRNLDIRFMTTAAVMVGAITLIADIFLRGTFSGGLDRRSSRSDSNDNGQAQVIYIIVALLVGILAPICARLLYLACSRQREYLADASSARFTRYPEGLARALEKIAARASTLRAASRAVAPMYIINPLQAVDAGGLFATHPPVEKRIAILRAMEGNAGLVDYQAAFQKIAGGTVLGARTLAGETTLPARAATPTASAVTTAAVAAITALQSNPQFDPAVATPAPSQFPSASAPLSGMDDPIARASEVNRVLSTAAGFTTIPCACGLTIKLPPDYTKPTIQCPRCGTVHAVPAQVAA